MNDTTIPLGVASPFQILEIDGVDLAYSDEGRGETLVCLHAVGHGGGDFNRIRKQSRARMRVVTLDWPGQGRSGTDRVPASAERYAHLLGALLDRIGVERAVVIGNSIGGSAAIAWAARNPERVRGLVLANPGGLAPVDLLTRFVCRALSRFFAFGARGGLGFRILFAGYYRAVLRESSAANQRRRIVEASSTTAPVLAEAWASFATPESSLASRASSVACPVLFTWAKSDQLVAFWRSRKAIESFPNAEVEMFKGGHCAFLEDPVAFDEALNRFLTSIE